MIEDRSGPRCPPGAVLLGADYRALGVVRSLGRRRVPVVVLAERGEPLATISRYAQRSIRWPTTGESERVCFLRNLSDSHGLAGWALIPSSDNAAALLARNHDDLARHYRLTSPPWEMLRWTYDKRLTYELAERMGVPYPRTIPATEALDDDRVSFPAILKPAVKEAPNALTTAKAWELANRAELATRYREAQTLIEPDLLMVQELVPGGGENQLSYAALCRGGEPLASLTARRTRQYPADFGRASTFVETVECTDIIEPSLRLLRELGYTGLIEIEYKRDPRDGAPKLLDMNPRVWGWQSLCPRAGVDFSWLLWLLASGAEIPPSEARRGVGWLRLATDTPTAVKEVIRRRLGVREYLRSLRRPREAAIFAWDDPLPGFAELPLLVYVLSRRTLLGETR